MQQQIEIKATDQNLLGHFSNLAQVSLQDDHFILDFFLAAQPIGMLVSRIVVTPSHMKAIYNAMGEQLKQYEASFGKVEATKQERKIGFNIEGTT